MNKDNNLYIGSIYNIPINSSYAKKETLDFFHTLQKKMTDFSQNDYVIIGGDFNARTGILPDFAIENEKDSIFLNLPDNYELDESTRARNTLL